MKEARDEIAWGEKIRQKRRNVVMVKMMKDESKCEEEVGGKGCSMQRGGEE